jgi:hypothetical protein
MASPDVGEIFESGYSWLEGEQTLLRRWVRKEARVLIRSTRGFRRAIPHFQRLLDCASQANRPGRTVLNGDGHAALRERLVWLLREARTNNRIGLTVLALLVAIDERFGTDIRLECYSCKEGTPASVPLRCGTAMPKPVAAFGTGGLRFGNMAPATGFSADRLFLEHQFARVTVVRPVADPAARPQPALHRSGVLAAAGSAPEWTVAVIDVLASYDELDVTLENDDEFSVGRYASDSVEAAVSARLEWALGEARAAAAHLVVAPELTLGRKLVNRVSARLGEWEPDDSGLLPMLIGGRLHEDGWGEPGRFRNAPAVVTPDGILAWDYWKARPFAAQSLGGRFEALGSPPAYLVAIDTPVGRVAVTICLDFTDVRVQNVLRELRASVLVVPAMTPGATVEGEFYCRARYLTNDLRAATIFSNSSLPIRAELRTGERCGRTVSFVWGSTAVPRGTPMCCHDLDSVSAEAMVSIYRMRVTANGSLSVTRDEPPRYG